MSIGHSILGGMVIGACCALIGEALEIPFGYTMVVAMTLSMAWGWYVGTHIKNHNAPK